MIESWVLNRKVVSDSFVWRVSLERSTFHYYGMWDVLWLYPDCANQHFLIRLYHKLPVQERTNDETSIHQHK